MILKSITINNYKSLGTTQNRLIVEDKITTIIGKNESGKSNILEALGKIKFRSSMNNAFKESNINRTNQQSEENNAIIYDLELAFTREEQEIYAVNQESSIIHISENSFLITGALKSLYKMRLESLIFQIIEFSKSNPFHFIDNSLSTLKNSIEILNNYTATFPYILANTLNLFLSWTKHLDSTNKDFFNSCASSAIKVHNSLIELYPTVFLRNNDMTLSTLYTYDQAQKEIESDNTLLSRFLEVINIKGSSILRVMKNPNDDISIGLIAQIEEQIDENINKPFQSFYTQEKIRLTTNFNNNTLKFAIKSNSGARLPLNERSEGLRWYINLFIDMKSHNLPDNNIIFLIDEPGETLHVNAQRKLLKLFDAIAENHQIIYTTHSPHMIDIKELHHIRAVEKNDTGFTNIYSSICNAKLAPDCQHDTLSPLLSAIGYDTQYNILPNNNTLNIVTEGITDYIYIHTFLTLFDNIPDLNIIPAIGASNIKNICSILFGWGCNFIALFDYDTEGVEKGAKPLAKGLFAEYRNNYIYVSDVSEDQIEQKTYKTDDSMVIENLISKSDWNKLNDLCPGISETDKVITAKKIQALISTNEFSPDETTLTNYKELFCRLRIIKE